MLRAIAEHDGEWSWYQLDRALSRRGVTGPFIGELQSLEENGYVTRRLNPARPEQPFYALTARGRDHVE